MRTTTRVAAIGAIALAVCSALTFVVFLARSERGETARCRSELVAMGPRCCARGQTLADGHCSGTPWVCPDGWRAVAEPAQGCVIRPHRVKQPGGTVQLLPNDWEAEGVVRPRAFRVHPFQIDATEVTHDRWQECVARHACPNRTHGEAGVPVTGIGPEEAAAFCREAGGRLPTGDEWMAVAMGSGGQRYPWGQTGLVCRRASYGLVRGPCGEGASGPDLAGARPDGATASGVLDLAGNVAEWTAEPGGKFVARGGSYRSETPAELRTWAFEAPAAPASHIGFRCAYEAGSE